MTDGEPLRLYLRGGGVCRPVRQVEKSRPDALTQSGD